jgi:general secretion pathway protein N
MIGVARWALKPTHGLSGNRRLKALRNSLAGLGMLLLAVALLLWFLPARWAMPWIEPYLHGLRLQQVQGLLWEGRAASVETADGQPLGRLQWQLSRRALLGKFSLQWQFDGPQFALSGGLQKLPNDQVEARDVSGHADMAALDRHVKSSLGQPHGELRLTIERALLQGGWPLQLQGQAQWQHAVMHTINGDVALGELHLQAQAQNGIVQAQLKDDGSGPLQVDGQLQMSPLGWRLDATLRPRQPDPALRRWLGGLGPAAADGSVHVQQHGGLVGGPPAPSPASRTQDPHES